MNARTLTLMLLLLGAAGLASADESMSFQNRGPKEDSKYKAWSRDWKSPTVGTTAVAPANDYGHGVVAKSHYEVNNSPPAALGTATVARATEDYGHGVVAQAHYEVNSSRSAALVTVAHARVTEDDGHGVVVKPRDGSSHGSHSPPLQAPEIDANSLVVALTLLGGALAILLGRRAAINPAG